jgi:chaperonin GroEL
LRERISKLVGGVSVIKVGSIIESELKEKIARVDDSVSAVRSAKEEGVLAGGGVALLGASKLNIGEICKTVCKTPFNKLMENAGLKAIEYVIGEYPNGYDVKEYKTTNMFEAGIVDSTKAIKHALINAVSASNTMLMTNAVLTNKRVI